MKHADIILAGGRIRTLDAQMPHAQALGISSGTITAVGTDEDILNLKGPDTKIIPLEGRLVLPGFIDSHVHYGDWALGLDRVELSGAASFDDFLGLISKTAEKKAKGDWILGQGWNEAEWPENRQPTVTELDRAAPDHPVFLLRCDMHMAAANTLALNMTGIEKGTPDPPEGLIVRDAGGNPDGRLRESAMDLITHRLPEVGDDDMTAAFLHGQKVMHQVGITGLCDMPAMNQPEHVAQKKRVWRALDDAGRLRLRVWHGLAGQRLDEAIASGLWTGMGGPFFRVGPVKYFADGGMGARTAWLSEPYLDGGMGMTLMEMPELAKNVAKADRAGLAVMIHAIGDRATREVISIFEEVTAARKGRGPAVPHRIEHLQMVLPEDLKRLSMQDVVASMQPPNMIIDINVVDECMGERGRYVYAFGDVMRAGVEVIFSSDAPVCDPNPILGIHGAVNRTRPGGGPEGGWYPAQRISVAEAVGAYTRTTAEVYGAGSDLGSLSMGKRADLIVLDRDIYEIRPEEIHTARVDLTMVDGEVVYAR